MEQDNEGRKLTDVLHAAADGLPGAVASFFARLLEAEVFVPLSGEAKQEMPAVLGEGRPEDFGFVTVLHEGEELVPIFSEKSFVAEWAGREVPVAHPKFSSLLWMVGEETWLHLNPSQDVGKEITPWEIELLKKGTDAIAELVAAQNEDQVEEIEVNSDANLFPELKRRLLSILELCPDLQEAFLVGVREPGTENDKPLLGLKYRKGAAAKKQFIRSEIEAINNDEQSAAVISLIDDLEHAGGPNSAFFSDAVPFYIAPAAHKEGKLTKASEKIKSLFSRQTGQQETAAPADQKDFPISFDEDEERKDESED